MLHFDTVMVPRSVLAFRLHLGFPSGSDTSDLPASQGILFLWLLFESEIAASV